jgi:hypothetical protein
MPAMILYLGMPTMVFIWRNKATSEYLLYIATF